MAKSLIQPPAGVSEMFALLQLLTSPDEVHEKLSQMEAAREQLNDAIERKETLERLQDLEGKARVALSEAEATLQTARVEAGKARAQAETDVTGIRAAVAASRDEWTRERVRMSDELTAKLKVAEERERIAAAAIEKAKDGTARADYRFAEATKLVAEYNEKLAALKGIVTGPA